MYTHIKGIHTVKQYANIWINKMVNVYTAEQTEQVTHDCKHNKPHHV